MAGPVRLAMAISAPPELATGAATRSLAGLSDNELVTEVRRGCDRAFEHLYERYHRRMAAYIYGMVGDYGRAEDVAQDVFMSALRRMRSTDRPIAFKPWVYEIAKNACIDQFRRTRRTEEVSIDADEGLGASDYKRLATTSPSPDAAVDQKLALDNLCGAFGGLSETHHEILVMREFEGMSYREIGEKLGMSRPSVESTLFRARRRLGEEYAELVSGERCRRVQSIVVAAVETAALGARDQRRLSAHLSHCQACRRQARLTGLDASLLTAPRGARAKIAALIPLPGFLRRRWGGGETSALVGNPKMAGIARLSAHAGAVSDPSVASWARAAAAAAALTVAGVAGGAAAEHESRAWSGRPAVPVTAPAGAQAPVTAPAPTTASRAAVLPGGVSATARRGVRSTAARTSNSPSRVAPAGAPAGAPALSGGTAAAEAPAIPSVGAGSPPVAPATATAPVTGALDSAGAQTGGRRRTPEVPAPAVPPPVQNATAEAAEAAAPVTARATEATAPVTAGVPSTPVQPPATAGTAGEAAAKAATAATAAAAAAAAAAAKAAAAKADADARAAAAAAAGAATGSVLGG